MPRAVLTPDGRVVFVDRNGVPMTRYNPGYQSQARMMDLLSRLPDAQLQGATGYGITQEGRRPDLKPGPQPHDETIRPLSGLPENNRGMSIILDPPVRNSSGDGGGGAISDSNTLALMEMRSRGQDAELLSITLDLELNGVDNNIVVPNPFGTTEVAMARCLVSWGIGGASFSAVCDWLQGTQLSIPANFVRIAAQYVRYTTNPGTTPPSFRLNAGMSYGNVGRIASPARFTEHFGASIAAGASVTVKIPKYAMSFCVVSNNTCNVAVGPFMGAAGATALLNYSYVPVMTNVGQRNVENSFPIHNGARFLTLQNTGVGDAGFNVIYTLAL